MNDHILLSLISGIMLLLYGVKLAGEGFRRAAGPKLRSILHLATGNRLSAVGVGAFITAIVQSSSATTVMLIGFVSAGLINFSQAIGVVIGSNIGTTITVQLIAFKVYDYALIMIGIGAAIVIFAKKKQFTFIGQGILGFAFIFFSLKIMSDVMVPLRDSALFRDVLLSVAESPVILLVISTLFTALVQSSAATIGIVLALSIEGLIGLEGAIPVIMGANIGTCATALLASIGVTVQAKRVAIVHVIFKIIGVIILLPFIEPFVNFVSTTSSDLARQIANAHTFFNVAIAIVFFPFISQLARLAEKMMPEDETDKAIFKPKYLNWQVLDSPDMAFGLATREALRMSDIAQDMYQKSIKVILNSDSALVEVVEEMDDRLDLLDKEIKLYITKISQKVLTEGESKREIAVLTLVNDLENIGDILDKNIMELVKKMFAQGLRFSEEGKKEIVAFHSKVGENFEMAMAAFAANDTDLAWKVLKNKEKLGNMERELKAAHIGRLRRGLKESIDTSSMHLDMLSNLKRINHHITNVSYPIISLSGQQDK